MNVGERLTLARQKTREKKLAKAEEQRAQLTSNLLKAAQEEIKALQKELCILREQHNETPQCCNDLNEDKILNDIIVHKHNADAPYSDEMMALAMEVQATSRKAYSLLVKKLAFPKERDIEFKIRDTVADIPDYLCNLENAKDIMTLYKKNNNIPQGKSIEACIAVDAIYFTPEVKFTRDGDITGIKFPEDKKVKISQKSFSMFTDNPKKLEDFLTLNSFKIELTLIVFHSIFYSTKVFIPIIQLISLYICFCWVLKIHVIID